MKRDVAQFIKHCHSCQTNKPLNQLPAGLLQPLPVPDRPWADVTVDLVTALPPCGESRYNAVCVFADLPDAMTIHNVFHVSLLHPYHDDGAYHPPPPVLVNGELEHEVQAIKAHKLKGTGRNRAVHFLVQWKGYGREEDTWEPADVVQDLEQLDVYLHRLQQDGESLPPGFAPSVA